MDGRLLSAVRTLVQRRVEIGAVIVTKGRVQPPFSGRDSITTRSVRGWRRLAKTRTMHR